MCHEKSSIFYENVNIQKNLNFYFSILVGKIIFYIGIEK